MHTVIWQVPEAPTEMVLPTRNAPQAALIQIAYQGEATTWAKEVMEVLHHSRLHHSRAQWNKLRNGKEEQK